MPHTSQSLVQQFYEKYPYPHYPIFAKPLWQDGYLHSTAYLSQLLGSEYPQSPNILSIGCGEMLPFILRRWNRNAKIYFVDPSSRSLRRARFRLGLFPGSSHFYAEHVEDFLRTNPTLTFHHMEAYGVLHHTADPASIVQALSRQIVDGGTFRVMVYNKRARAWIWHLNRMFRLAGISAESLDDVRFARQILVKLCEYSPLLKSRLQGSLLFKRAHSNNGLTWIADTFMHPHELQVTMDRWLEIFTLAGFKPVSLFDRYAELDDLENPLIHFPSEEKLRERIQDLRFENNLEIIFRKQPFAEKIAEKMAKNNYEPSPISGSLVWKAPPRLWFSFRETKNISRRQRLKIWKNFCDGNVDPKNLDDLDLKARQRLVRLGAILGHAGSPIQKLITHKMDQPYQEIKSSTSESFSEVDFVKKNFPQLTPEKMRLVAERLRRALRV